MSERVLSCIDTVSQPYPRVRDALLANPGYVFRHATAAATTQAATLHTRIAGLDIGAEVAIAIENIEHDDRPSTTLTLYWHAVEHAVLFPTMKAKLELSAASATETKLRLDGEYYRPLGKLGEAFDVAIGHRIAVSSVTRFLHEVVGWLQEELVIPSASVTAPAGAPASAPVDSEC
jgi:hypothetical protein